MLRWLPLSLAFFMLMAFSVLIQMIPYFGIFFIFIFLLPLWPVLFLHLGMIGIGLEALIGRISRWLLLVPLAFYGGYSFVVAEEHRGLRKLTLAHDAANERISARFDPLRQALVVDTKEAAGWLTRNYAIPVTYSVSSEPHIFRSHRMVDSALCEAVKNNPAWRKASITFENFKDLDAAGKWRAEKQFCMLSMFERPRLPVVRVTSSNVELTEKTLPVRLTTSTITAPDSQPAQIVGGFASPLRRIPIPFIVCVSFDQLLCRASFMRRKSVPTISGSELYKRDLEVLARTLGLKRMAPANRRGADPVLVRDRLAAREVILK